MSVDIRSVVIHGRRWFRRGPGNTYHSATVLIDGKPVANTGIHYGYGDSYVETAFAMLETEDLIPKRLEHANGSHEAYWQWAERTGIALHYSAADVARERDL